jgi:ADP-ribose pyrophosphatase YjhB (NUDIX family)
VKERVRAILITPDQHLLTIRRTRPGQPPYWVLPGGGVEDSDRDRESALQRELHEELAATADIHRLVYVVERPDERQYIYLGRIHTWTFAARTGPEFIDPTRGDYRPDLIPLTAHALSTVDLKPDEIASFLTKHLAAGTDLFGLADLRFA